MGTIEKSKMTVEMFEALKLHIIRQREKRKQEQEQDAAMERHRWEQEQKRKRDALSLEEIKDKILKFNSRLNLLRDQKNELYLQLKRVLNEEQMMMRERADVLAAHQQALAQQQINLVHPFPSYHYLPSSSLVVPARPGPAGIMPATSESYRQGSGTPPMKSTTGNLKRRHDGSPSPTPPPRPQSSGKAPQNVNHPPKPTASPAYHFYYPRAVPSNTVPFDPKNIQYVSLPYPEGISQRDLAEYESRHSRSLQAGSSSVMPIQTLHPSVKSGGITSGFPVRTSSSSMVGNPSRPDKVEMLPHRNNQPQAQLYPRNYY